MSDSEASKKDAALDRPATDRAEGGDAPAFMTEGALLRLEEGLRAQRKQQEGRRFLEPDARSQRAGVRVVNKSKSGVAKPSVRKFGKEPRRRIAPQALARFKPKTRELTRRTRRRSLEQIVKGLSVYLIGWRGYFDFCQTPSVSHSLENWLQRRLRAIAWKQWKRGPTSSRPKIRTEEPVSSPFGRRQKVGLLLCGLLLVVGVAALEVSLKARTGGTASVNIETRGRTASVPPDNDEPRPPITNAVKSSVAASSRWNFVPLDPRQPITTDPHQPTTNAGNSSAATPSLLPDNDEPRPPTTNAGNSSAATPSLLPDNDEPRPPTTNAGNSSAATPSLLPGNDEPRPPTTNAGNSSAATASLSLPPLPRHRPMNNRSRRKGPPHQPKTNGGNSSAATASLSLPRDNDEIGQLITKAVNSSAATPSLLPDGLTPSLVLRRLLVIVRDIVDLPADIAGKLNAVLRGDPRLLPASDGPAPETTTNIAEE